VTGLFLVAGTALESSRKQLPLPQLHASVVLVMGTGDATSPYRGGRPARTGLIGFLRRRRAVRHGELPGEDIVAGAEEVVYDWAAANGIILDVARPAVEELPVVSGDLPVTRTTWTRPGCHPAILYRIDGGRHGWPGGPRFPPKAVIGPIPRQLDATGLLLDMTERETAIALGHSGVDQGELA
jgi:poly(3-hydroxybutyrate) depolymerase